VIHLADHLQLVMALCCWQALEPLRWPLQAWLLPRAAGVRGCHLHPADRSRAELARHSQRV